MARLIDSSVVIELERRGHPLDALPLDVLGESAALAAITASELLVGVHRATVGDRRRRRQAFIEGGLNRIAVLPFDLEVARTNAHLAADLMAAGAIIGANDLLIAATALAHGPTVLTHNLRDFERVPGLVVRQPSW